MILTLLVTHLDAGGVAASLRQFPPDARVLVCHGGSREDFDAVAHPEKIFVEDPSLRGPLAQQQYTGLLVQAWNSVIEKDEGIDLVFLAEYDHIVLRNDFEIALRQVIDYAGADFVGKNCSRRDTTNWWHSLRARGDARLHALVDAVSTRQDPTELYGCLGTGMLIRRKALEAFATIDHVPGYLELYVPTLIHHLGFRLDDVDRFSDLYAYVNAPPEKDLAALRAARSEGHFFCHPFKRVDQLDELRP